MRHLKGHLDKLILLVIFLAGAPGVVLGALFILDVNGRHAEIALGILTLLLSLYSWFRPELGLSTSVKHRDVTGLAIGAVGLFIIGFANGALSAGSGLFVTLWLVSWFGLSTNSRSLRHWSQWGWVGMAREPLLWGRSLK